MSNPTFRAHVELVPARVQRLPAGDEPAVAVTQRDRRLLRVVVPLVRSVDLLEPPRRVRVDAGFGPSGPRRSPGRRGLLTTVGRITRRLRRGPVAVLLARRCRGGRWCFGRLVRVRRRSLLWSGG